MATQIAPYTISAPGFYGLNLSDSPTDIAANYALVADNAVIDRSGRISSRKGWSKAHVTNADLGANSITCIGELIQNDGTATTLATGNNLLFKLSGTTFTKLTYGGGGVAPTISADNWQFVQLNGVAIFFQSAHDPLIYDPVVSTTTYRRLSERSGYAGTVLLANAAIGEYGRIWCGDTTTDKYTVKFSDLLAPHVWTGGTSGSLDLRNVWTGGDEIVAFAAHNNFLFIFGRKQILIYAGADDPSTMALTDKIVGIGCIARDSVQVTGEDVWFLSDSGVRSLMRTIQEKSSPIRTISKNVQNDLQEYVNLETTADIKSGFSAVNNFYLLSLPNANTTYCFDTKAVLEDGSAKTTTWNTVYSAYCETKGRKLYLGTSGYIGLYNGTVDNETPFRFAYYSPWVDFGNPLQRSILKKLIATIVCYASMDVVFKWAFDFDQTYNSETVTVTNSDVHAEYGRSEFGIGEYSKLSSTINQVIAHGTSSGRVVQIGIEVNTAGSAISLQKIDAYTKDARI